MPETGQPGGAGGHRSGSTQAGMLAAGSKGPFIRTYAVAAAAGNVVRLVKCPKGLRWNVLYVHMFIDTDATVADRYLRCFLYDEANNWLTAAMVGAAHAANTTADDYAGPSESDIVTLSYPMPMCEGMGLNFNVANGVAGDSWYAFFTVMEWKI